MYLRGNYSDDSEGFQGWWNECGANKNVAQMTQRWSRRCWKWSMFWKTCIKQSTWECWTCVGCNQQRSVTDSARTRGWSGDSKNFCVQDFDAGSWRDSAQDLGNVSCQNLFCSSCHQSRRNIVLQLLTTWFKTLPITRFPQEALNWRWIVGLQIWSRNEGLMEVAWRSMPERGRAKSQLDQNHAVFFWLGRHCPSGVCYYRPNN